MNRRTLLPSISDLLAFEAAARHASFTRAALELNLTQSAVSRNIRVLEEALGIQLFERVRKRVVLSPAGAIYMQDVQRILDDLRDATHRAMTFSDLSTVLNLAVLPSFASSWLVPRLPGFIASHPDITINFSARLQPFNFAAEKFDGAIHHGKPVWPGGVLYHLMDEVLVVVANQQYLDEHRIREPGDLARATLLHLSTRPLAWADWLEQAGAEGVVNMQGPRYEQFSMLGEAVAAGLGIGLLPRLLVEEKLALGQLVKPFEIDLRSASAYYWVVPEEKGTSGAMRQLTQWLLDEAHGRPMALDEAATVPLAAPPDGPSRLAASDQTEFS